MTDANGTGWWSAVRRRFAAPQVAPGWQRPGDRRVVDIGWLVDTTKAQFIWGEPRKTARDDRPPTHAKSANYCPSVIDHEARLFDIPCPIDLKLGFRRDEQGQPKLVNLDGARSTVRNKTLGTMLVLVNENEWRHPDRPVLQFVTPYVFVADEPVWMTQMPPIAHYQRDPWPGILIGGRLPIHVWPRPMMWAFEWHEPAKPIVFRRGEPWFAVRFETHDPARPVRLFEAERTPELVEHMQGLSAVSNYVNRTQALYKVAAERRPERLLQRKQRKASTGDAPV